MKIFKNEPGWIRSARYLSPTVMSDPLGGYMEIREVKEEEASGIRVGLLTYNDPSETYSTYGI